MIQEKIIYELKEVYEIKINSKFLDEVLMEIYHKNDVGFIFIVDEWDCVFRHKRISKNDQEAYLDFLRLLFKEKYI